MKKLLRDSARVVNYSQVLPNSSRTAIRVAQAATGASWIKRLKNSFSLRTPEDWMPAQYQDILRHKSE